MMDLLFIGIAILAILLIMKIAAKILKAVLILAVIAALIFFLAHF